MLPLNYSSRKARTSSSPAAAKKGLTKQSKKSARNVTGVQGDAGNLADLDRLFEIVKNEKGRIDVLFASAGFGELSKPLGSITEKGFDDTFNVNVRGTLFTVQKGSAAYEGLGVNHSE